MAVLLAVEPDQRIHGKHIARVYLENGTEMIIRCSHVSGLTQGKLSNRTVGLLATSFVTNVLDELLKIRNEFFPIFEDVTKAQKLPEQFVL